MLAKELPNTSDATALRPAIAHHDIQEDTRQDTRQHTQQDTRQDTQQDTLQDTRQDTQQDTQQDTRQDTQQDTQQDTRQDTQQDTQQETRQDTRQHTQQDTQQDTRQDTRQDTLQDTRQAAVPMDPKGPCLVPNSPTASKHESSVFEDTPLMDFDMVLPYVGEFGLYQKCLFLLMIPFAWFVAFVYFSQIFITLLPEGHWCQIEELQDLSLEERLALGVPRSGEGYARCIQYDVNFTALRLQGVRRADPSWPTIPCTRGWEFNHTEVPYDSVAAELEWVCDSAALPNVAQSVFFGGAIVGGLLFGWVADRWGRVPSLVGANLVGCAAGVATAWTSSFWAFALCRFLVGMAFDNCFTMVYILVLEYVGPKWRTFVANMSIALFFTMAACLLPWLAYWLADWRLLCVATAAPLLVAAASPWLLPESARWLVSQGRIDEALVILKRLEKVNGTTVPPEVYQRFQDSCQQLKKLEDDENHSHSVVDLLRSPRLRNTTLLLVVIWMVISLVFDGHVRNFGQLGLDVFVTFTVASATELPADTLLTLVLDRWGRRWLACGSLVISGVFSLAALAAPPGMASASLAIMGRFSVNISYNIGLQYAAELLPTVVRAQGVALIHIMGYVASILAPFVVYLSVVHSALPLLILGTLGVAGGVLALFLPETLGKDLPQTLADGEQFGRDQRFLDFPCCSRPSAEDPRPAVYRRASIRASTRGELHRSSLISRGQRGSTHRSV